jgi:hypothetical protein
MEGRLAIPFSNFLNRTTKTSKTSKKGLFRLRTVDVVLWWVLISLLSISFVANHPLPALVGAIAGGALIGVLSVLGADPL